MGVDHFCPWRKAVLENQPQWWTLSKAVKSPPISRVEMGLEKWEGYRSSYGHKDSCSSVTLLSWMPSPRKLLVQVSLGLCLMGSWRRTRWPHSSSLYCRACGAPPCLVTCGQGAHFPGPAYLRSPDTPAAWVGETRPALGVWAKTSEVSGTEASGSAGYGALQHVSTITEPMQAALVPAAHSAPSMLGAAGTACSSGSPW